MTLREFGQILRAVFNPCLGDSDELRRAIEEKRAAGDRLMLVGATITATLDGHNDVHRSVVEATRRAGEFM